ncbi:MAG: hypothetical protein LBP26_03085 [Clostridiales bacterium]|nr:hypothetical protein [Clostridiales bacterium]
MTVFLFVEEGTADTAVDDPLLLFSWFFLHISIVFSLGFSSFEARIITRNKRRALRLFGLFDIALKTATFGLLIAAVAVTNGNRAFAFIFLAAATAVSLAYVFAFYLKYRKNTDFLVFDFFDIYRDKTAKELDESDAVPETTSTFTLIYSLNVLSFFASAVMSNGSVFGRFNTVGIISLTVSLTLFLASGVYLFFKVRIYRAPRTVSGVCAAALLISAYCFCADFYLWGIALIAAVVAALPILYLNSVIGKKIISRSGGEDN